MLQINFIRDNKEQVIAGLKKKYFNPTGSYNIVTDIGNANPTEPSEMPIIINSIEGFIDYLIDLDSYRKEYQHKMDTASAQLNQISKEYGILMKQGKQEEANKLSQEKTPFVYMHYGRPSNFKKAVELYEKLIREALLKTPNLPHESVPPGRTPEENVEVYLWGEKPTLPETAKPHWDLIEQYDIIDFKLGTKITGAGFPVYKGKGARIQRAMIQFFLDKAVEAGYMEVQPPILINAESGFGTGQLPDKEGQMYHATADDLYLIPTAEVPITNLYRDVIVNENELPIKNVGYTPCFRREAGSWGAHVRGLNRLHQFDKVEIVQVRKPEESYQALDEMAEHVKGLLQALELPFRIIRLCGGDMGFTSALTYDFEVWSGAQGRWLECSSVSNFETYQANRLKLRYKVDGKTQLLHTLNGSALALPRILAALLENNQTPEGIRIPKALVPYCGFEVIN